MHSLYVCYCYYVSLTDREDSTGIQIQKNVGTTRTTQLSFSVCSIFTVTSPISFFFFTLSSPTRHFHELLNTFHAWDRLEIFWWLVHIIIETLQLQIPPFPFFFLFLLLLYILFTFLVGLHCTGSNVGYHSSWYHHGILEFGDYTGGYKRFKENHIKLHILLLHIRNQTKHIRPFSHRHNTILMRWKGIHSTTQQ